MKYKEVSYNMINFDRLLSKFSENDRQYIKTNTPLYSLSNKFEPLLSPLSFQELFNENILDVSPENIFMWQLLCFENFESFIRRHDPTTLNDYMKLFNKYIDISVCFYILKNLNFLSEEDRADIYKAEKDCLENDFNSYDLNKLLIDYVMKAYFNNQEVLLKDVQENERYKVTIYDVYGEDRLQYFYTNTNWKLHHNRFLKGLVKPIYVIFFRDKIKGTAKKTIFILPSFNEIEYFENYSHLIITLLLFKKKYDDFNQIEVLSKEPYVLKFKNNEYIFNFNDLDKMLTDVFCYYEYCSDEDFEFKKSVYPLNRVLETLFPCDWMKTFYKVEKNNIFSLISYYTNLIADCNMLHKAFYSVIQSDEDFRILLKENEKVSYSTDPINFCTIHNITSIPVHVLKNSAWNQIEQDVFKTHNCYIIYLKTGRKYLLFIRKDFESYIAENKKESTLKIEDAASYLNPFFVLDLENNKRTFYFDNFSKIPPVSYYETIFFDTDPLWYTVIKPTLLKYIKLRDEEKDHILEKLR